MSRESRPQVEVVNSLCEEEPLSNLEDCSKVIAPNSYGYSPSGEEFEVRVNYRA